MRTFRFLQELKNKDELLLSETRPALADSYTRKAQETIDSAKLLLANDHTEAAAPLLYYAMLYASSALLAQTGIRCKNHAGTIILTKELFHINTDIIAEAKQIRERAQYDPEAIVTRQQAKELLRQAITYSGRLYDCRTRLTNESVQSYQKALRQALTPRAP